MHLPIDVKNIIERLEQAGYEAYAVGGCVRDSLLNEEPGDYDITTSAEPLEVKALFKRTFDTGIKHGTVTVLMPGGAYEVTTYRVDGEYEDMRHPKEVTFTRNLKDDLSRRDFTINAMAYNEKDGLIDLFNGKEDLEKRVIRCVGDPIKRFSEDALRMLRAVRFSAKLGFSIEKDTLNAINELHENLKAVSAERIYVEFIKTVLSDNPDNLKVAYDTGLLPLFLDEVTPLFEDKKAINDTFQRMKAVDKDHILRLGIMFSEANKKKKFSPKTVLKRLKTDRDTCEGVEKLVNLSEKELPTTDYEVRRYLADNGLDMTKRVLALVSSIGEKESTKCKEVSDLIDTILKNNDCITLKTLAVTGNDVITLGVEKGTRVGTVLEALFDRVLQDPSLNNKDTLTSIVKKEFL